MTNILIIGCGFVGGKAYKYLEKLNPDIIDKYKPELNKKEYDHYDFAFIAVDTPYLSKDNPCDITEVRNAIMDNEADMYIIKSTILPGYTEQLIKETGKHIIFYPEYNGNTIHSKTMIHNYTVLGGIKEDCKKVQQMLQQVCDASHKFMLVDSKTAELAKYMENCYLATKVSFCNQFYDIAKDIGIDYEDLREIFIMDPRISPYHTFVYDDKPYWDSHCLNKDVNALADAFDAQLLKDIIKFNNNQKYL